MANHLRFFPPIYSVSWSLYAGRQSLILLSKGERDLNHAFPISVSSSDQLFSNEPFDPLNKRTLYTRVLPTFVLGTLYCVARWRFKFPGMVWYIC